MLTCWDLQDFGTHRKTRWWELHLHVRGCYQVFGGCSHTFPKPCKSTGNLLLATPSNRGNLALTGEETAALQRVLAQEDRYLPQKAMSYFSHPLLLQQQPTCHQLAVLAQGAQQEYNFTKDAYCLQSPAWHPGPLCTGTVTFVWFLKAFYYSLTEKKATRKPWWGILWNRCKLREQRRSL